MDNQELFVIGLKRMSALILDNVGISIPLYDLPSYPDLLEARRRLYGSGILGRLWARRIRPVLKPERDRELGDLYRAQLEIQKKEFYDEIIKRGAELGYDLEEN